MANTFSQIHIQSVFAVKYRKALIHPDWKDRLYNYIIAMIQNRGHKVLAINGTSDHIHIFFGMRPTQALSNLMSEIKRGSSEWININKFTSQRFLWQEGYGGFSYKKSDIQNVVAYINNQEIHHRQIPFIDEYKNILNRLEMEYDERYIFHSPE